MQKQQAAGSGQRAAILSVTAAAAFWRFPGLFANGFQADEALFASFARTIAVWQDPLLRLQPVDKPPLLFYAQAVFYPLFGPVEWAARLPDFIASILLIPLAALLAWRLFGDGVTAVLTAVLLAFSPLAIQFSPTAFTDPLLTTLLVAALAAVMGRRPFTSGLLFGLALATKYQAVLFLPLLLSLGAGQGWRREWGRWLAGVAPVATAVFLWEMARTGAFTLWQTQVSNYGGIRLVGVWELRPRLADWLALWRQGALVIGGLAAFGLVLIKRMGQKERLLIGFVGGYFLLHWLLAVPVWGRYLLLPLPLAAIVAGRALKVARDGLPLNQFWGWLVLAGVIAAQLPMAAAARDGRYSFGSYPGADGGAAEVARFLADAPYGTVLYDHWFSWQWRYHLFDKKVFVNWFPDADSLVTDLTVFAGKGGDRYLVLPNEPEGQSILPEVQAAGFQLNIVFQTQQTPGMSLYRISR